MDSIYHFYGHRLSSVWQQNKFELSFFIFAHRGTTTLNAIVWVVHNANASCACEMLCVCMCVRSREIGICVTLLFFIPILLIFLSVFFFFVACY